ncbi:MAG TPA: PIN domain-containing protein [Chloroflexota bacterium]|nr:PIN domain-containing protein [Chloroflexota bacterium]
MTPSAPPRVAALDASVLLRYLLADDPEQSPAARALVESDAPLAVTPVTIAEAAWVLANPRHRVDRVAIADALLAFLARDNVFCIGFDKSEAQAALLRCRSSVGADFGDALTAACARSAGISEIFTFDSHFGRAGISPVTPPQPRGS